MRLEATPPRCGVDRASSFSVDKSASPVLAVLILFRYTVFNLAGRYPRPRISFNNSSGGT